MKKLFISVFLSLLIATSLYAQGPKNRDFGFGLILGDPTGVTIKYWMNNENALDAGIGSSFFGSVSIYGDYLWHFDAFNSRIVELYAGPGIVLGIGEGRGFYFKDSDDHDEGKGNDKFYYRKDEEVGIAGRGIFGINIIPRDTPLEIFVELGVVIGFVPAVGTGINSAIGIRFYP